MQVTRIQNMIGVIEKMSFFAAHPKRQTVLERAIEETQPETQVHKPKDLFQTHWAQFKDVLSLCEVLYQSVQLACNQLSMLTRVNDLETPSQM